MCFQFVSSSSPTVGRESWLPDGATSEWRSTVKCVGSSSVYPIYTSRMFELVENRLYTYADDSTLLEVVRTPADRPAVAVSLNNDLAWINECCNHCCMILNLNKTKALMISKCRTANPPHGELVLSVVSIRDISQPRHP